MSAEATTEVEEYNAKKMAEVAQESQQMIGNSKRRMESTANEFLKLLDDNQAELKEAAELVTEAKLQIEAAGI
ncbi:hypothetical protein L596_009754 [Steinernema carpocapsae]|uniref:Tubulin-specific chaperone A n=1 Tax=Steinernema carpocapsae TaxID=34508 RepID=A0A4U5PH34_STECR|nr:hypothetical protein L596_009754 [Steinernema carpocapsae]